MNSKKCRLWHITSIVAAFFVSLSLSSCRDENSDAHQEERIVKWIDAKRYSDVIYLLEPRIEAEPQWKPYLGEAYLGDAGFEPFSVAARVMDQQPTASAALEKLFPHCPSNALRDFDRVSVPCVLKRLIKQLPEAEHPSLRAGLNLLVSSYPRPETTAPKFNILIGSVALGSALSRLGTLLTYYDGLKAEQIGKTEVDHLFSLIAGIAKDASLAVERAKYSNDRITTFITGLKSIKFFNQMGNNVQFDPQTGLSILMGLGDSSNKDLETSLLKVLIIQNLDRLVEEFKRN